ncbi:MAG: TIGR01777 family protein, partial [Chitinophagaceae bacterium]|nr:TIGR01777 family protein [Chitinophagaceae bacterium]
TRNLPDAKNNRNEYHSLSKGDLQNVQYVRWDGKHVDAWKEQLNNADILINLSGKSVNCRYTEKNKQAIINSRIDSTAALGKAMSEIANPPKLWINSSSATIYRHAMDKPQDEYSGEILNDFSVSVCKQWEQTFFQQQTPLTRKIALRMAITIGSGGVMLPYYNLLKFGLGGKQGSGKQMYSWIHIEDTCRIINFLAQHTELEGIFNCSSPHPVTNDQFMQILRKVTNTSFSLPAPGWMLQLGAIFIGTETELVMKSRWVVPAKLLEAGYTFRYPEIKPALENIIQQTPQKQYKLW